jgi:hypothetical protein
MFWKMIFICVFCMFACFEKWFFFFFVMHVSCPTPISNPSLFKRQ